MPTEMAGSGSDLMRSWWPLCGLHASAAVLAEVSSGRAETQGPSTANHRSRANDDSALGMTGW